jgi:hypothetical protein
MGEEKRKREKCEGKKRQDKGKLRLEVKNNAEWAKIRSKGS